MFGGVHRRGVGPRISVPALTGLVFAASCSSGLGPLASTDEGFFFSGDTRLSYALDIPVEGSAPFPLVVVGHDSSPEDKNSRKEWARRLVETGVAVLRFDKRGVGDSDGEYRRGYADLELLSGDLVSAVDFVANDPRVDIDRIRLLGSRQAGWILPMVATRSPHVAFVILLSGPTVTGAQHNYWDEIADDESLTIDQLTAMLADFVPPAGDHDPRLFLEAMTMPALWMFGREDRIIPSPRSAEILEEIVAEFQRPFTVIMYENAGHGLRDVESNDRIPYWDDLLPWLEGVIR
jgi:alpha/beta superfamily hydrolase